MIITVSREQLLNLDTEVFDLVVEQLDTESANEFNLFLAGLTIGDKITLDLDIIPPELVP